MRLRRLFNGTFACFATAVVMFLAAGAPLASNMAFKFNKSVVGGFVSGSTKGDNWIALPWNNPTPTYTSLCAYISGQWPAVHKANVTLSTLNPTTGTTTSVNCAVGSLTSIPPRRGIRLRITGAAPPGLLLVGSHNDGMTLPDIVGGFLAPGPKGDNWVSLPYHSLWTRASDICAGIGLTTGQGNITQVNPATGITTIHNCGLLANNFTLLPGQAVRIRKVTAGPIVGVVPPHY